uniref:Penicillin-binding protein activator LpoB n=1 Tax=Eiseniibacteriota bacterium TaxID=2212470 RepID=A0A832I3U5_UNCEI
MRGRRALAAGVALALLAGCAAGSRLYVNPQADLTAYRKVALLPFGNLTGDRFAAERVSRALMTELIADGPWQLVEPAEFWATLGAIGGHPGQDGVIAQEKLKEAAARLGVQAVIRGAVTEYQIQRLNGADLPVVGFDVEMVDAPTGHVIWRTAVHTGGRGRVPVVGGQSARSLGVATQRACATLVGRLRDRVF